MSRQVAGANFTIHGGMHIQAVKAIQAAFPSQICTLNQNPAGWSKQGLYAGHPCRHRGIPMGTCGMPSPPTTTADEPNNRPRVKTSRGLCYSNSSYGGNTKNEHEQGLLRGGITCCLVTLIPPLHGSPPRTPTSTSTYQVISQLISPELYSESRERPIVWIIKPPG